MDDTPGEIMERVADYFGVTVPAMLSKMNGYTLAMARRVAWTIIRRKCNLSYPQIAVQAGRGVHTTVISAVHRVEDMERLNLTVKVGNDEVPIHQVLTYLSA